MPIRNRWLPREGFTVDVLGRLLKKTVFNPAITFPLLLLARFTQKGNDLSVLHETAFSRIKILFGVGLARWVSSYLDAGFLGNWTADRYDWNTEIAVVTGGAGGIEGHVVRLLAEKGIKVAVLDVIPMTFEGDTDVSKRGPNAIYHRCDITDTSSVASVAAEIRSAIGSPTILVNNAGVCRGKSILEARERDIRFTFDVNTLAHYWLAKEFVPAMVERNHGMIITVASLAAYVTVSNMVDYAASKAATYAFHEGLAAELNTRYNALKVRTVLSKRFVVKNEILHCGKLTTFKVSQGYTKSALFEGFGQRNQFLSPTLEVETVAEGIVRQILTGRSGQVILPGIGHLVTILRSMPHWVQISQRNGGRKLMENWKGRQVMDLDKKYERKTSESESTILVKPEE